MLPRCSLSRLIAAVYLHPYKIHVEGAQRKHHQSHCETYFSSSFSSSLSTTRAAREHAWCYRITISQVTALRSQILEFVSVFEKTVLSLSQFKFVVFFILFPLSFTCSHFCPRWNSFFLFYISIFSPPFCIVTRWAGIHIIVLQPRDILVTWVYNCGSKKRSRLTCAVYCGCSGNRLLSLRIFDCLMRLDSLFVPHMGC